MDANNQVDEVQYVTEDDVKLIVEKYGFSSEDTTINYKVKNASNSKMLGFLAEYLKLEISLTSNKKEKVLRLFIKAVSKTNSAKANFVKEIPLYEKELKYYELISGIMKVPGLKPWSAKFVTSIDGALVLDDLYALQYPMRNKYAKFDKQHTLQALNALARFHASTIIFEEKRSKELQRPYRVNEDYETYFDKGIFTETNSWFSQCRDGALEAIKVFSKYSQDKESLRIIESRWRDVFNSIFSLSESLSDHRTVISHRDLWNNNLLFHYKRLEDGSSEPDDCVLVDFQMVHCQPPAADVMLMLNCNLESQYRKNNLNMFLNYYYDEFKTILSQNDIKSQDIIARDDFLASAQKYNQWGHVLFACFVQIMWPEDQLVVEAFKDSEQFNEILTKDKATFLKNMMERSYSYRKTVMGLFEEIIDEYIMN